MKKIVLSLILFFACFNVVSAQTCDCAGLQTQIDELRSQIELLQNQSFTDNNIIEPTDYHQQIYIDKDYLLYVAKNTVPVITNTHNEYSETDYTSFTLKVNLINQTPFPIKFSDKVIIRAYQGEERLLQDLLNYTNKNGTIGGKEGITVQSAFMLNNDTDDVTLEVCEAVGYGTLGRINQVATWVIPLSEAVRE